VLRAYVYCRFVSPYVNWMGEIEMKEWRDVSIKPCRTMYHSVDHCSKCNFFNPSVIPPGEVKVELDDINIILRENFLCKVLKIPIPVEKS
jgi:hypothetical protein